jgi:hypothetical protein
MVTTFSAALRKLEDSGHAPETFSEPFVEFLPITGAAVSTLGDLLGSETVSATDDRAAHLDELQFDLGEGPCWDALRSARPVRAPELLVDYGERWPSFVLAVKDEGVRSMFAFPLLVGPLRLGAVDLYSVTPVALDPAHESRAETLAEIIGRHILRGALGDGLRDDEPGSSPLSRRALHQATGIVLAQLDLPPEDARLIIHGQAFASGRPVIEVADEIVGGRLRFRRRGTEIEVDR